MKKRYWFVTYTQPTSLGEVTANACLDMSPVEWAATYCEVNNSIRKPVVRFAMEITQEEFEMWADHF